MQKYILFNIKVQKKLNNITSKLSVFSENAFLFLIE